jgi:hypothetical protein
MVPKEEIALKAEPRAQCVPAVKVAEDVPSMILERFDSFQQACSSESVLS